MCTVGETLNLPLRKKNGDMRLLEELAIRGVGGVLRDQSKIPHAHITDIKMFRTGEPLSCGSEYFIAFNDAYTLGFSREEIIEFRDDMVQGINKSLAATAPDAITESAPCFLCKADTTPETAFKTILGWMHFECDHREKPDVSN